MLARLLHVGMPAPCWHACSVLAPPQEKLAAGFVNAVEKARVMSCRVAKGPERGAALFLSGRQAKSTGMAAAVAQAA